jgi:bifunctional DNA-binding transcriptional regulator/antitoxin component of YhaV-PrlF toxin-antitoxin module
VSQSTSDHVGAELTVNDEGGVTIPASIRQAAGIEAGVPLVAYLEDGRVMIETREQLADRVRREVAAAWTGDGSAVEELIADRRAEAAREDQQ